MVIQISFVIQRGLLLRTLICLSGACSLLNKATGLDNISAHLLKENAPIIVSSLTYIINLSIHSGILNAWKIARVTPIFKEGLKSDPNM